MQVRILLDVLGRGVTRLTVFEWLDIAPRPSACLVELADTTASKAVRLNWRWGFDSLDRHKKALSRYGGTVDTFALRANLFGGASSILAIGTYSEVV